MRSRSLLLSTLLASLWVQGHLDAFAQDAPFGLSWGPVAQVPRPSLAQRETNITALIYLKDRVPADLRDTDEIVLEVCASEGLQHVIWVSRLFSEPEARAQYEAAVAEGMRRFGQAEKNEDGRGVTWPTGRTTLTRVSTRTGAMRVLMTSAGPDFEPCSKSHLQSSGHLPTEHLSEIAK